MNKADFISKLKTKTNFLPTKEQNKVIEYYTELIEDKLENGEKEKEIIKGFGPMNQIIEKIKVEQPTVTRANYKIIVLIICSPLLFTFYLVGYILLITMWIIAGALALSSVLIALMLIPYIICIFLFMWQNPSIALFQGGLCLSTAGLGILLFIASYYIFIGTKKYNELLKISLNSIRKGFLQ